MLDAYARRIRDVYHDLAIETIVPIEGHGQNNDIVIVNDRAVFRFPRYPAGVGQLKRLIRLLRAIRPRVSLAIPNPIWVSLDHPTPGQAFIGYPLIPGAPLLMASFDRFDEDTKQMLANQLAAFLKSLHAIPPADVLPDDVASFDPSAVWRDLFRRIHQKLFVFMRPETRDVVTRHFERFFDDPRNRAIEPALVHGDFGGSNVLFDPASKQAVGVVDFDSAGLGDPALDFAAASMYGLARLFRTYSEAEAYQERIAFYQGTFALQEALFGIENGDGEAFEQGIAPYR